MPAKGKSKVTDNQRKQIATAKLIGKTAKEIAAETGLGVRTVEREVKDPRTATFILEQRRRSEPQLRKGWDLALASLLVHLQSNEPALVIAARRDLLKFATAGDPPLLQVTPVDPSSGDCTLEELITVYRNATGGTKTAR